MGLTASARELWEFLAGDAAGFAPAISVAAAPPVADMPAGLGAPEELHRALPVAEMLGPASLAYLDQPDFRPDMRIARALGFRELGAQVSIRLAANG